MSDKKLRSTSTNKRLKLLNQYTDSSSLASINRTLTSSSTNSLNKSEEKSSRFRLPRMPIISGRSSVQDTSVTAEASEESISTIKKALKKE